LGSGFIADKAKGLIVTAGHLFYDIAKDRSFTPLESGNTDAIIGVYDIKTKKASFKYTADIAVNGLATGDCCILRLTGKFVNNVDSNGSVVSSSEEIRSLDAAELEGLSDLPLADSYDMNTSTRTWGYGQEDDAFSSPFESINRSLSNVSGFVTKILERPCTAFTTLGSTDIHRTENQVVVNLIDAIARDGLSGGPVVNGECQVVGIQSICDPADEKRTFVVPSTIIKELLTKNENEVL
jgi:S1-C subfamily serine protease